MGRAIIQVVRENPAADLGCLVRCELKSMPRNSWSEYVRADGSLDERFLPKVDEVLHHQLPLPTSGRRRVARLYDEMDYFSDYVVRQHKEPWEMFGIGTAAGIVAFSAAWHQHLHALACFSGVGLLATGVILDMMQIYEDRRDNIRRDAQTIYDLSNRGTVSEVYIGPTALTTV